MNQDISATLGRTAGTERKSKLFSFVSLFTSFGTLLCCALPSLLVLFGLGATVASFLSAAPWLVTLSQHKIWVFAIAGILIASNFAYIYRITPRLQAQGAACPPDDASACQTTSRFSRILQWISAAIYVAGVFTAFVLGPFLMWWDAHH